MSSDLDEAQRCSICSKRSHSFAPTQKCGHLVCTECRSKSSSSSAASSSKTRSTRHSKHLADARSRQDSTCPACLTCSICMDQFNERSSIDCCEHQFCFNCITRLAERVTHCPICDRVFNVVSANGDAKKTKKFRKRDMRKYADEDDIDERELELLQARYNELNGVLFDPAFEGSHMHVEDAAGVASDSEEDDSFVVAEGQCESDVDDADDVASSLSSEEKDEDDDDGDNKPRRVSQRFSIRNTSVRNRGDEFVVTLVFGADTDDDSSVNERTPRGRRAPPPPPPRRSSNRRSASAAAAAATPAPMIDIRSLRSARR